jgi:hypothetical protein
MLGLRQRLLAEGAGTLEFGRHQRGQLQGGTEREPITAEVESAFDHRRDHEDAGHHDALIAP